MSLKQEIETWVQALSHYDTNEFDEALKVFSNIADTSKILFNCGVIHATIGEHDRAVDCYQRAIGFDQYLAVAYFQEGVSNFLVGDFEEALANFNDTLLYLRGNTFIDYEQLGLKFKLYSCEVLFNRGLCYVYLQQDQAGMQDFQYAVKEKMTLDHDVIDDAIREKAQGYTVFSIPVGVVYRPSEAKVKNLKTKDYLGRARLVATANAGNTTTGFQGAERRRETEELMQAKDDRPLENISYAATNLVQRDLGGRAREQSAPPTMGRSPFPPTPPPENETKSRANLNAQTGTVPPRSTSVRKPGPKNLPPLQMNGGSNGRTGSIDQANNFEPNLTNSTPSSSRRGTPQVSSATGPSPMATQNQWSGNDERPRLATTRSASESRGPQGSRRLFMERSNSGRTANVNGTSRPLYGETQRLGNPIPEGTEPFDDVYAMYGNKRPASANPNNHTNNNRPSSQRQNSSQKQRQYPEEEDDDIIIESDSADEGQTRPYQPHSHSHSHSHSNSLSQREPQIQSPQSALSQTSHASFRPPSMSKIRVKVHTTSDIRYIMIHTPTIDYDDFESRVRAKFSLRGRLKIKSRDDDSESGDMVTMSDQDDLDTLVASAKAVARRERTEMGKMEVWVQEV